MVDKLRVHVYPNRQLLGQAAAIDVALYIQSLQQRYPLERKIRIIFAAAPSQNEILATLCNTNIGIDWSRIEAFHMDEYIGLHSTASQLFSNFLDTHIWSNVQPSLVHKLNSSSQNNNGSSSSSSTTTNTDAQKECERYSALLLNGPIDIVCLGIGENGHLAFNDPPVANFEDTQQVKIVELETVCRQQQVNDGCFAAIEDVPTHALTLTIPALLRGTRLFCCVPGKTKRTAVQQTLLNTAISTLCPATILRTHPDTILYIDNGDCNDGKPLGSFDTMTLLPLLHDKLSLNYISGLLYNPNVLRYETMDIGIGGSRSSSNHRGTIQYIARHVPIVKTNSTILSKQPFTSAYILPGLMDIQINGFNGVDFNTLGSLLPDTAETTSSSHTVSTLLTIARSLASHGITSFIPTLITNPLSVLESAVTAIHTACLSNPFLQSMIKGIHLEGPFISPKDGYRGCHKQEYCLNPDYTLIDKLQSLCGNRIVLITLAPELPGSIPFIEKAVKNGIKISIGHTNANEEEIRLAVAAGATLSTHLGNGIASVLPRHPNPLWSQLANDNLWCSLITDGQHLPSNVIKVIIRSKQIYQTNIVNNNQPIFSKVILISDAVPLANMPPGIYNADSLGGDVVLTKDNRLYLQKDPSLLAGSVLTLDRAIEYLLSVPSSILAPWIPDTDTAWDQRLHVFWHMGSYNPSIYLHQNLNFDSCSSTSLTRTGTLQLNSIADIVITNIDKIKSKLDIQQVWKEGRIIYEKGI